MTDNRLRSWFFTTDHKRIAILYFAAITFFFFIGSLTRTTVANTNVLMSVSPFLAALAGRWLLREPVPLRTWLAMAVAFGGIVLMFADSIDAGRLTGNRAGVVLRAGVREAAL